MSNGKLFLAESAVNRAPAILIGAVLVSMAGCADRPPRERGPDAPTPTTSALETGSIDVTQSNADARREQEIALRSTRWKRERRVEDFLWLVEHAIPAGSTQSHVRKLLGDPLEEAQLINGGSLWRYVKNDPEKQQFEALSVIFDEQNKVVGLGRKPIA